MTIFETLTIMLSFGIFVLTLLAYIESRNKRKEQIGFAYSTPLPLNLEG